MSEINRCRQKIADWQLVTESTTGTWSWQLEGVSWKLSHLPDTHVTPPSTVAN